MSTGPKPRLRDLGISIGTLPTGEWNAITDVPGVSVGHTTVIFGDGPLRVGEGPARTGVTAIHPHDGSIYREQVPAAIDILNGAGEITGRSLVDEYGVLTSPILITNTLSVGEVHRGCVEWMVRREPTLGPDEWVVPVVAETYDGTLNDIAGQHVTREHTIQALDSATRGPVAEGNVGGGTGMLLFGFKGGIGTASRRLRLADRPYTLGVLVQGNFGRTEQLVVDGVPVGRELLRRRELRQLRDDEQAEPERGSIIVVVGTDIPLSDRQLGRLCRRAMLGLARTGSTAGHGSGDLMLAFSNAPENRVPRFDAPPFMSLTQLADAYIDSVFRATVEATEEAVINAMVAAETMTGRDGITRERLPHDELREIMRQHGRLQA